MRLLTYLLFALAVSLCAPGMAAAHETEEEARPARVLVVHSYNPEYIWCQNVSQGIQESLRGLKATIETRYLDAKRDPAPDAILAKSKAALERVEAWDPQVVIAVDDAAQTYLVKPHLKGRPAPQVIFCGVNAPLSLYGFPASNVSGVRERWHLREGFALLKKINPKLRSVALLLDDTESAGFILEDLKAEARQGGPFALKVAGAERIKTYRQWQRRVRHYQKHADALALGMYHALVDETTGRVAPANDVNAWTTSVNQRPTLGFADYAQEHGLMCGVLESAREQGLLAGAMARQVLERGATAGSLPVRINQKGVVFVNLKTAERLGQQIPFEIINAAAVVAK